MREGLRKLPGVEAVEVSLNRGRATIQLAAGNHVRLEQVWNVVKEKGFTPREAAILAEGELIAGEGKPRFKVSRSDETYDLMVGSQAGGVEEGIKKHLSKRVVIEGEVPPPEGKSGVTEMRVKSVKPAEGKLGVALRTSTEVIRGKGARWQALMLSFAVWLHAGEIRPLGYGMRPRQSI